LANKRILYLISRENIIEPGVLKSQVLDLAGRMIRRSKDTEITVLNLPSINRFLRYFRNYSKVKDYARSRGIRLVIIPIIPVGSSFMPVWAVPFFMIQSVPLVLFFALRYRVNIIHTRSYLSALTAAAVKKMGVGIKLVFDTRSLYLREAETFGGWQKLSADYRFWERLESRLFAESDRVVVQAFKTGDYVRGSVPTASVSLIPSPVSPGNFRMSSRDRERGRRRLGLTGKFVFAYSGSLGRLHDPRFLAKFYSLVRRNVSHPHFLVATQSNPAELLMYLNDFGAGSEEITVLNNPDLGKILPLGDAGLHVYGNSPIAPYASSVKMPEYSASGIPIVVTKNMTSIVELVERSGCGVAIDPLDKNDIRVKIQQLVKERERMGNRALDLAKKYFSVEACANKYLEIYDEITPKIKS